MNLPSGDSVRKCYRCLERTEVSSGNKTMYALGTFTPLERCEETECAAEGTSCVKLDSGDDGITHDVFIYRDCLENVPENSKSTVCNLASAALTSYGFIFPSNCEAKWKLTVCTADLCNSIPAVNVSLFVTIFATVVAAIHCYDMFEGIGQIWKVRKQL